MSGHGACQGSDLGQPSHPGPRGRALAFRARHGHRHARDLDRHLRSTAAGRAVPSAPPRRVTPVRSTALTAELLEHRRAGTNQRGARLRPAPPLGDWGRPGPRPHAPRSRPAARDRSPPTSPCTHLRGAARPPLQPTGRRDRGPADGEAAGAARRRRARGERRAAPSKGSARDPGTCYRRGGYSSGSAPAPRRRFYGRRRRSVRHLPAPPGGGAPRGPAPRSPPSSGLGPPVGSPR